MLYLLFEMDRTEPITTSLFDLFKVGPGPSSSHTIGPMKAAYDFINRIKNFSADTLASATAIDITLFGSLAATGKAHGIDRALLSGLLGKLPEACDPQWFSSLMKDDKETYLVPVKGVKLQFTASSIHYMRGKFDLPHPNTMILRLMAGKKVVAEEEYYSIGGGFIVRKGEEKGQVDKKTPKYPYATMKELKHHIGQNNLSIPELIVQNEMSLCNYAREEICARMDSTMNFMQEAVHRGLKTDGLLPGPIKLHRKAMPLYTKAQQHSQSQDSFLIFLNAYCEAAAEENAAGNIVVTAPTSGSSGVIPGLAYLMKQHFYYDQQKLREGLLVAAAIGFLVKHNASISGAEMGCMGEIGTASAMGAAMLAYCAGCGIDVIEAAAEIAIEHHLGMTCDPIGGYVQIPCIERNAMGAVKAYNSFLLASSGKLAYQKVSLDSVIKAMKMTGDDMSKKYKETSEAGLALSSTEC